MNREVNKPMVNNFFLFEKVPLKWSVFTILQIYRDTAMQFSGNYINKLKVTLNAQSTSPYSQ